MTGWSLLRAQPGATFFGWSIRCIQARIEMDSPSTTNAAAAVDRLVEHARAAR